MALPHEAQADEVVIYGSDWCGWTQRAFKRMKELNVPYRYVDVDADAQAEALIGSWNNGRAIRPTYSINGAVLVHPDDAQLSAALREHGYIDAS